jgi:hypothetical protein
MLAEREPDRELDSKCLCEGEGSHSLVLAVTPIERGTAVATWRLQDEGRA